MQRAESVLTLPSSVNVKRLLANPKRELLGVLKALPDWAEAEPQEVHLTQISGALTNLIYRCHYVPKGKYVLARIFGCCGALFERSDEQTVFAAVAHAGLGPKLLANFENGRLEEFLLDQSITASQMRSAAVADCVAAAMAMFHFTQLTKLPEQASAGPICWDRLRAWATAVQELYTPDELHSEGLGDVMRQIDLLETALARKSGGRIGFCHNDLQYGNMLLRTATRPDPDSNGTAADYVEARSILDESFTEPAAHRGAPKHSGAVDIKKMARSGPFSVVNGMDAGEEEADERWSFERPDDVEQSQGSSPRKHPRGLTTFRDPPKADSAQPDNRNPSPQEADLSIRLIDYEYAGTNPVAYDIANHWCEWAADYHSDEPHRLDYSNLPNEEQQKRFTTAYAAAVRALRQAEETQSLPSRADSVSHSLAAAAASSVSTGRGEASQEVTAMSTELAEAAVAYMPVSHLQWGIWGLLQARLSQIPSFDFTSYGRQRLEQWTKLRPKERR